LLNELAAALAKAQAEIEGAAKGKENPHFRSKYADLASVWEAVRAPLTKHGISVVQSPSSEGARISVETVLMHTSGQWMRDVMSVTAKDEGPQAAGSCITYLRRYALQSFAGVAPEDDDAEGAEGRNGKTQKEQPKAPEGYEQWFSDLTAVADEGTAKLQAAWSASDGRFRAYLTGTNAKGWEALKAKAQKAPVAA